MCVCVCASVCVSVCVCARGLAPTKKSLQMSWNILVGATPLRAEGRPHIKSTFYEPLLWEESSHSTPQSGRDGQHCVFLQKYENAQEK